MKDKTIRVLLVEDDKVDQLAFEKFVRNKNLPYDYTIAGSIEEAREILQATCFDAIITNHMLGDGVSFELFELLKDIPVIITTGTGNEEIAIEAMKLGADDYLIKDPEGHYLKTLPTTVELALKRKQDKKELQKYHLQLESMVAEQTAELRSEIAKHIRIEEVLRDRETQLRTLINTLPDLVWLKNQEGVYLFCNPKFECFFGAKQSEIIGKTDYDFVEKKLADFFRERDMEAMTAGKASINEEEITYADDGHKEILETIKTPLFDNDGKLIGVLGVGRDITDRKKNEIALRKSEEMWDRTFNSFTDSVILLDADLHTVKFNQAACTTFDLSPDDIIGQYCYELFAVSDEICQSCPFLETKETVKPFNREIYHEKLGKFFLVSAAPVLDEEGKIEFIASVAKDITEIKESEKDRMRLSTAIEQATEVIVITDKNGSIQYANPAFEILTGYTREEAIGQNPRILQSGKHDQPFYKKMWTTLLQGEVWRGHLINKKKDGSLFEEEATITPVINIKGRITNFVAVKRDVSKELTLERQLQHAIKMEAVGTLAGGIAHDFNNILAAIIGYAEIIRNQVPADSLIGKDIVEILAAGQRATDLVNQILTFSRKTDTEKQPLRPHLIVKEVLKMMEASLPSTIQIETDIDADCGLIMADPTNIHQVTVNLCTNSFHAMADQKGTLRVSLQRCELSAVEMTGESTLPPGTYVVLTVSDTGCGIDKATMEHIFNPFYTTKEVGKGTGLGLAVIHGIVQDAQGFIRVKSTPGEGSSFSIYFPLFQEKISMALESDPESPPLGGSEHILVVDDEPLLVRVTQRQLEHIGYQITGTTNSLDALEIIRTIPNEIDLLISDQTMPGLTGTELAQAAMKIKPDLPVILCTGHSDLVSRKKAMELGIKKYISKPLVSDELFRAVRSVLKGK